MKKITLICTEHQTRGACNSDELYKILEAIEPKVIFEEMPLSAFDDYYINKSRNRLETDTIILYKKKNQIEHIPVDHDDIENQLRIVNKNKQVHIKVEKRSRTYCHLIDTHIEYCYQYGFKYLNSKCCEDLHKALDTEIVEVLKIIENENLTAIYKEFCETLTHKRESVMLENIIKYSMENDFERGVFFIGAGHRYTIIEKIQELEKTQNNIKWNYNNYDEIL